MLSLISWNVNGIRAAIKKGLWEWFDREKPDIFLVQEVKAYQDQISPSDACPPGYKSYWQPAEKKGYSGVAAFCNFEPLSVTNLGAEQFDCEGRVQVLEFDRFSVINAYFPNSQEEGRRLDYKLEFGRKMLNLCDSLRKNGKNVVLCGDYNIAHKPIDLKNPKANEKNPGYFPEERLWMDQFTGSGFTDTFRMFNMDPGHYTWWSYRYGARIKDIGWRIDYFCVNEEFSSKVESSSILKTVMGSDHCPIRLKLNI